MPRKLPNLNAVKAFDAAARHQSFTEAAAELCVTQAAISRQIRLLEEQLNTRLFSRGHRKVELTIAGRRYAKMVEQALLSIALDTGTVQRSASPQVVIDVDSDLAELWLRPLMQSSDLDDLGVSLDIRVHPEPQKMFASDADLAITWGQVYVPGFQTETFLQYTAFPVCSPSLIESAESIKDIGDCLDHRLIHDRGIHWWDNALVSHGYSLAQCKKSITYHRTYLCMYAAADGLGVAIGDDVSSAHLIKEGKLIRPCGPDIPGRMRYNLLVPEVRPLPDGVYATIDWLKKLAKSHQDWFASWHRER
ncbi:hypothetical protein Q672_20140 [Marinobacter sp. EVN1]|uniref:LysR family transcriptional regulator n=1 Tax=Marinobacter sp. EVN1 TaxID=1397532 RepID=UPI0003B8CB1C|nr:hypothetical protein Q672_20140 [Marinobacter sp. EVN1]